MIPLDQAVAEVLDACGELPSQWVPVAAAVGHVLAEDVRAVDPVPPFANSAMDGFAVRAADIAGASSERPARLKVIGTVAAGHVPGESVREGEALRIMTGALFPEGADTVAIVETTRTDADYVLIDSPASPGDHVRGAGEDIAAGAEVFSAGTVLGPGHVGVLCSVGREAAKVVALPRVGVLSTGDELVEAGAELRPGKIRDSNRRTLLSLLARDGFGGVDFGIVPDDEAQIEHRLREAAAGCDAILTSGGVSMGDFDYVKAVLDRMASMRWMQLAIRPAKPFAFGVLEGTPVFGLPGNPVSSMVSYELLARPALRKMGGYPSGSLRRQIVPGVAGDAWRGATDGRTSFVRVLASFGADGRLHAANAGGQGSHQLHAMSLSNALAVVEPEQSVRPGDPVPLLLLGP